MNDKFINQVYWDSGAQAYYTGSQIKATAKQRISFVNRLMEPGASIISWESAVAYQAEKLVPALPILQVNHQYRLKVGMTTNPEQAVLIRLEFFNLQGERIKKMEFYSTDHQFVYPVGAYSYKISLVNSGAVALHFSRLQIADAQTAPAAFADIWLQDAHLPSATGPDRFLLLVQEGKQSRARYTIPALDQLPYQVVSVAWQFDGDLVEELGQRLAKLTGKKLHLISTTPATDKAVASFCVLHPNVAGLVTDRFNDSDLAQYQWIADASWYSPEILEPDWLAIGRAIKHQWKEEDDASRPDDPAEG